MVYVHILTDTGFEESVMKEEKASMKFILWVDCSNWMASFLWFSLGKHISCILIMEIFHQAYTGK